MVLLGAARGPPILAYTKLYVGDATGTVYEVGALRFATAVNTYDRSGVVASKTFPSSGTILFGANAAWGKFGIQSDVNLTVTGPGKSKQELLSNQSMAFLPAQNVNYNFFFKWNYTGVPPGTYRVSVSIADAH